MPERGKTNGSYLVLYLINYKIDIFVQNQENIVSTFSGQLNICNIYFDIQKFRKMLALKFKN